MKRHNNRGRELFRRFRSIEHTNRVEVWVRFIACFGMATEYSPYHLDVVAEGFTDFLPGRQDAGGQAPSDPLHPSSDSKAYATRPPQESSLNANYPLPLYSTCRERATLWMTISPHWPTTGPANPCETSGERFGTLSWFVYNRGPPFGKEIGQDQPHGGVCCWISRASATTLGTENAPRQATCLL